MSAFGPLWHSPLHRVAVPLLMAASLAPIWSSPYFPSQNGPWHLLTIQMLHEYDNPAFNYAEFYVHSLHAIPHLAHTLLVYALAFVFPLLVAHQIAISVYALLLPISMFWFLGTVNPRAMAAGYVSFLLIYNVPLLRGYHDYVLGIPLVLLTLTYWLRHRQQMTAWRTAIAMLLIVCVYLSHIFNFLLLGLAMLVYTLHDTRRVAPIARLALLFVPASLLLGDFVWMSVRETNWMDASELEWRSVPGSAVAFFRSFFYTLSLPAFYVTVATLLLGIPYVLWSFRRVYDRFGGALHKAVLSNPTLALFFLCLTLYFATPYKLFGWHYVDIRFVPYVVIFAAASLSIPWARARRVTVGTITVASLVIYGLLSVRVAEAGATIEQYLSGLHKTRPNTVMLPLAVENTEIGEISVVAHAFDYYPLFLGGANGKGIAQFNTVTPMVYRNYPISDRFPRWRPDSDASLDAVSAVYDYVLIWGWDPYPELRLRDADFELIHQNGNLRLFENRLRRSVQEAASHE